MTTQEVANRFWDLVRQGKNAEAQQELYADNVECIEMPNAPMPGVMGKQAVAERLQQWYASVEEVHDSKVTEPLVMGNHFSMGMAMDLTMKGAGRNKFEEVCLYQVEDGKIVKERYFY
ncbi:MAG: SnoaL-like domain-containing protein [Aurantibacter sp.]